MLELVIGNRNYSSWSLRAWWFLTESGVEFAVRRIPMFTREWREEIAEISPAGRVPVLLDGEVAVWDTTAIVATVREQHPGAVGWPDERAARALARSIYGEMHSGFLAIRDELPQNLRARHRRDPATLSQACRDQIARIEAIWTECRERHGARGPWLFGALSLADVMFAPVALRFVTYGIDLSAGAMEFVGAVQENASIRQWIDAAAQETESIPFIDDLTPAADSPLTLG